MPLSLLATALIPVLWTYDGWADPASMAGEIRNPQRNLPLALIAGAVCVMLVYLVVNIGFLYAISPHQMAHEKLVAATVASRIPLFGGAGAAVIAAAVVISAFSGLNASMMTGSRIFYAMADRGLLFRAVAHLSPRFATPPVAIALATALGVAYVLENDFSQLADKFILGISGPSTHWRSRAYSCCVASAPICPAPIGYGDTRWCPQFFWLHPHS